MITKAKKKFTGQLRQRVTVMKEELISDGMGGQFPEWTEDFKIWANVKPVSGSQRLHLDAINSNVSHVIETRYRDKDLTDRKLSYKGRSFNIQYHLNQYEENAYTEMAATEEI